MLKKKLIVFSVMLSLAGLLVNCEGFLEGGMLDNDPNRTTEVPLLEQLVGIQPVTYGFIEADIGIFSVLWMQQMAGVVHQYDTYENYQMTATMFDGFWSQIYQEGGLIDMNEVAAKADEQGLRTIAGIAKIHEALVVAAAADVWGAIPYSEAAQPDDYPTPVYDDQSDVHDAVLLLLDEAIADFTAAEADDEYFDGGYDFAFGGDRDMWIAAAHTLKARILLNWAKVRAGNYALAAVEAGLGISSTAGNWVAPHADILGEQNIYWQWDSQRPYAKVGHQLVSMLADDPRQELYFETIQIADVDTIVGSAHTEGNETGASWLNYDTFGAPEWDFDMVTYEENQFIIAECEYKAGDETGALATMNATLLKIQDRWSSYFDSDTIPLYSGITGTDLHEAIMNEKYKALFLNPQVWNDWKRTGYPTLTLGGGFTAAPRRFLYPEDEINTNDANMPQSLTLFDRNENDPN
ncbi:MAG: SusD/RagB family nutrient-binding outer membrane lipoprotein [Candidatus Neomarinimicrobiota bacterium]